MSLENLVKKSFSVLSQNVCKSTILEKLWMFARSWKIIIWLFILIIVQSGVDFHLLWLRPPKMSGKPVDMSCGKTIWRSGSLFWHTHTYTHTHMYIHCICVCDIFIQKWNAHNNIHVHNFTELYVHIHWQHWFDIEHQIWTCLHHGIYKILCLLCDYEATKSLSAAGQRMSSHLWGVFPASPSQGCPFPKADKFTSLPGAPRQRNGTDAFQW